MDRRHFGEKDMPGLGQQRHQSADQLGLVDRGAAVEDGRADEEVTQSHGMCPAQLMHQPPLTLASPSCRSRPPLGSGSTVGSGFTQRGRSRRQLLLSPHPRRSAEHASRGPRPTHRRRYLTAGSSVAARNAASLISWRGRSGSLLRMFPGRRLLSRSSLSFG
jgi:hypothetical protein